MPRPKPPYQHNRQCDHLWHESDRQDYAYVCLLCDTYSDKLLERSLPVTRAERQEQREWREQRRQRAEGLTAGRPGENE